LLEAAAHDGVVKASMLASAGEARGILEQARHDAARLLHEAQDRVDAELRQHQLALEQRLWRGAADYAEAIGGEWDRSLAELEARMTEVVGRTVRRLVENAPAEERVRVCVQQLISQVGAPDTGALLVAEEDHAAVLALADSLPWSVQRSSELPAGTVRLVSARGRWECDVHSSLERLLEALGTQKEFDEENDHGRH
jgi:vacuolar-type H+-ATPase subunit E/Vma4